MATVKQVEFAMRLMAERDAFELRDTLEYRTVSCGRGEELSPRQMSRFIEALLECPRRGVASTGTGGQARTATEKQVAFAARLIAERKAGDLESTSEYRAVADGRGGELTAAAISQLITALLACPRKGRRAAQTV